MRIVLKLGKRYDFLFLIIASFIFFLFRLPSLFEPYWYGDEGIYHVIGEAINRGGLLYRDVWDNKPPLLYLLYAILNSDQFTVKLVSLIFGVVSIVVFFFLAKKLFPLPSTQKAPFFLTAVFALLFGIPLLEGNIANAENFMIFPILIAAFLIFNSSRLTPIYSMLDKVKSQSPIQSGTKVKSIIQNSKLINFQLLIAGFLLGIAFLFKVVAIFDFLAFFIFLIVINLPRKLKSPLLKTHLLPSLKRFTLFTVGFLTPVFITIFYFFSQGAVEDFIKAAFLNNIDYVAWQNRLIFTQGFLLLKTTLLVILIILIVYKRNVLSLNAIFILLWFVFSLYNVFFTQRPYTHYLLTILPSASLMMGLILWEKKYQKIITLFFILAFIVVLKNFSFYGKTIAYYQNFASFLISTKSVSSYREFFDKRTPTDYEIAAFIKSKAAEKDSIFVWGNNPQVYKLVGVSPPGKYIVAYHIIGNKDALFNTEKAIEKKKPRFIIIMPDQGPIPISLINYSERIIINGVSIYERFI